jgi:hypothetical protein
VRTALIHRARLVSRTRGARNVEGEYPLAPAPGPWFKARLMERGGVAAERRRRTNSTDAKVSRGYELLVDTVDETGAAVTISASSIVETDCPILGSPTLELEGEPERLNNGTLAIGWVAFAQKAKDAA